MFDDIFTVSGKNYCRCCLENTHKNCHACGKWESKETIMQHGGRHYCPNCYSQYIRTCDNCGNSCQRDRMVEQNGRWVCENCHRKLKVIKDYNYTPDEFNYHKLDGDNCLFLGIEVEVETNKDRGYDERCAKEVTEYFKSLDLGEFFYIKHDGTVEGFELVTQPATLRYMHEKIPWNTILKWFVSKGYTSYKTGNCGLHIHMNKKFFTPLDIHKLRLFFSTNKAYIYKFSKRQGFNDKYCQYEDFSFGIKEFITEGKKQEGKYWAIRTRPTKKDTVELRVFRGTLSYPRFLASLQFTDALAHYIKWVGIMSCQSKNSWIEFIRWCSKENMYQHFLNYIKSKDELIKPEI